MSLKNFLETQIITKTIELIIQNRIDVKKTQMKQLASVMQEIHKNWESSFGGSIQTFLNQLLLKEMYDVRIKLQNAEKEQRVHTVRISFFLNQKRSGNNFEVEHWELSFQRLTEYIDNQSGSMIVYFFQELLLLLNRQPLFKQYQKSKYIKNCYVLDHKYEFLNYKNIQSSQEKGLLNNKVNVFSIPAKYQKIRTSLTLKIDLTCYYVTSLRVICGNEPLICATNQRYFKQNRRKSSGTLDLQQTASERKDELTKSQRKMSVYTFYDEQLDITFISSDNETFKKGQQGDVQKYEIQQKNIHQQSDEFEMLFVGQDESFVSNNNQLLQHIIDSQKKYFQFK